MFHICRSLLLETFLDSKRLLPLLLYCEDIHYKQHSWSLNVYIHVNNTYETLCAVRGENGNLNPRDFYLD